MCDLGFQEKIQKKKKQKKHKDLFTTHEQEIFLEGIIPKFHNGYS
jgi:hypothetical protein